MSKLPVIPGRQRSIGSDATLVVPAIVAAGGDPAAERFMEFFAATIRNRNTREAYYRACLRFLTWCEEGGLADLPAIRPMHVSAYIETMTKNFEKPTVKQHLAAIRMMFDYLVTGHMVGTNPATSVRGPTHVVKRGKTPVLLADEARAFLNTIDTSTLIGLRDRALVATMIFSFARISAVVSMRVEDFYVEGKRWYVRLHEKGGKRHEMPAHHLLDEYLEAYIKAAGIESETKGPLFRSMELRTGRLRATAMNRIDAYRMIRKRAAEAELKAHIGCHTFRATGITAYLEGGGTLEKAQTMAAHESPRTTKLYDRTSDAITLDEVERIRI